ncbi:MAG: LptF/LptG family permease [Planctomycetes bacterium]|nr:LptF/LptG family permease [Planctomycetota bacterium]NOG55327.1 LptF/LptG family permease [Planctomycetota bacterium]
MPLVLFWYIMRDLLKVLAISTSVLVVVIAFGAAIKPISDGALGPLDLIKYIGLAIPPMLQFAVPFSAAFSATIVYHRMAADNEVAGCAASGVPYTNLLMPAATLGVALTIGLSVLANYVSPWFWERMERTAHLDAPEFFLRSATRGVPVKADKQLIYARNARRIDPPEGSDAYASLWVEGLLVVTLRDGIPSDEYSARQALFDLHRRPGMTVMTSVFRDPRGTNPGRIQAWLEHFEGPRLAIPDQFRSKTKFMALGQLQEISDHPETFWKVATRVDELRMWLSDRLLYAEINQILKQTGRIELTPELPGASTGPTDRRWIIYADSLRTISQNRWQVNPPNGRDHCRIILFDRGRALTEYRAKSTIVDVQPQLLDEPILTLELRDLEQVNLTDPSAMPVARDTAELVGLRYLKPIGLLENRTDQGLMNAELRQRSATELVQLIRQDDYQFAEPMVRAIRREIGRLQGVILSRLHERTALSLACLIMMLLGSVLALALRNALPLTVYLLSFIPAVVGILLIASGSDLVKSIDVSDIWGLLVLWSGNAGMAAFVSLIYWKVTRN